MRKLLLASTAAAVALAFSGQVLAETARVPAGSSSASPTQTGAKEQLVFSKNASEAKPMQMAAPAENVKPADQTSERTVAPMLSAQDEAVAQQLRELAETKLNQYITRDQDRAGVLTFYRDRNFAPLWTVSGKLADRTQAAADYLAKVNADGLDPEDYATPQFGSSDPAKLAANELSMTNAVITYARHASIGRVAFSRVSGAVYFDQKAPEPAAVLGKIAEAGDVGAALDSYQPQHEAYKALKAQLAVVRGAKQRLIDNTHGPVLAERETKKSTSAKRKSKDEKKDAQAEEKPNSASADTIIANMERWRWMPHDLGATYVMVNIPDYTLKVVHDGKTVWQTKIVVGKVGSQATPLLTETMKYITVNPTWNVPPSIIRNEYLPALAQDPNALARVGLKLTHNPDGSVRIYQPPGERNALGRLRFNFPNKFLVYQHDTPDKHLFQKTARAFSHGCMRVQNPDKYAEVLLGVSQPEDGYTTHRIKAMYGDGERTINFKKPIPVYISYQTAFADDAARMQSRADVYGLDKDITRILHSERRVADVPIPRNYHSSSKPVMSSSASSSRRTRTASRDDDGWGGGSASRQNSGWGNSWGSSNYYPPVNRFRVW